MFPDLPSQEVQHALSSEGDAHKAAERLSERDGKCCLSINMMYQFV